MKKYYHGVKKRKSYFEGWYMKYRTKDGKAIALIPALHIDPNGRRSASLQVITEEKTWWLTYPEEEFEVSSRRFQIRIGRNVFCKEYADLHVNQEGIDLHGVLRHGSFTPLKSDIMGPFRFIPGMECSHGVISMEHALNGILELNGEIIDFSEGIGYIETDRGCSFPDAYLWTQCNWPSESGSMMLAIAAIPAPLGKFTGCICTVFHEGKEYRLTTYRGVRIHKWSEKGAVIRQGKYRLMVEVLEKQGRPLKAPAEGRMNRIVHESLCAKVRCRFWKGRRLLFDRTDCCAGFEFSNSQEKQEKEE